MTVRSFKSRGSVDYGNLSRMDIPNLDQALYVASCFAANSTSREVAILTKITGGEESYCVIDTPIQSGFAVNGWTVSYVLSRPRAIWEG